jgi:phage protein D
VNGSRLRADVSHNIEEVQVVSSLNTTDSFSLTVANALPKMRWTHTSDADLFREGNSVKVELGYVDDLQEMIEGEITQVKATFPSDGVPVVIVEGNSRAHRLQGDNRTRTFQQMTDKQIAEKIAQEAGLECDAEDTEIQHDYVMQGNESDLDFLRSRAQRIHFEILVDGKTLIFRKVKEAEQKMYTLVWGPVDTSFSSAADTLPLKSFSPELNALQPGNVEHRAYDVTSKQAFVSRAGAQDQTSKMGGQKTGVEIFASAFQRQRQYVHVSSPCSSQAELDQRARGDYNERALRLVGGSGETIGIPDLRKGHIVQLKGIGPRFEGYYRLKEVTHLIDSSGYQTSFRVDRNGLS